MKAVRLNKDTPFKAYMDLVWACTVWGVILFAIDKVM